MERAAAFGVTAFDIADDDSVQLWVGGELVGWFKPGAVEAVYYADTVAEPQAG